MITIIITIILYNKKFSRIYVSSLTILLNYILEIPTLWSPSLFAFELVC